MRYWVISPGEQGRLWDDFQQSGVIAIGWDPFDLGDLTAYQSRADIHKAIVDRRPDGESDPINASLCLYQFAHVMKEGDIVVVDGSLAKDGSPTGNARSVTLNGKRLFAASSQGVTP